MRAKVPKHELHDDGLYPATLNTIEPKDGETGVYWRWTFTARTDDGDEFDLIANSSATLGRRSKAYGWLTAVLCRDLLPGEELDFDEVLPASCRIMIKRSEDGQYDRVDDVLRSASRQQSAPTQQSPEAASLMQRVDTLPAGDGDEDDGLEGLPF